VCVCVCVCVCTRLCIGPCQHLSHNVCLCVCARVCVRVCMCPCLHICTQEKQDTRETRHKRNAHAHTHTYTYAHTHNAHTDRQTPFSANCASHRRIQKDTHTHTVIAWCMTHSWQGGRPSIYTSTHINTKTLNTSRPPT